MAPGVTAWLDPPSRLDLRKGEVHLWRRLLSSQNGRPGLLPGVLSPEEIRRGEAYHFSSDRNRFLISRAWLREVLARYLPTVPGKVRFTRGAYGKLYLEGSPLQFSLSHCRDLALIAVCRSRRVGVDVERVRRLADPQAVIERFFSSREAEFARSGGAQGLLERFFLLWTRREAAAKALGLDLLLSFDRFEVPLELPPEGGLLEVPGPGTVDGRPVEGSWFLRDLEPDPGYRGAVCVEGRSGSFRFWSF